MLESLLPTRYRSFAACRSVKPLRGFHRGREPRPTQAFAIQLWNLVRHFVSYFSPIPFEESRTTRVFHFFPSSYQLLGVAFGACPASVAYFRFLPFTHPNCQIPVLQGSVSGAAPGSPTSQAFQALPACPPRSAASRKTLSGTSRFTGCLAFCPSCLTTLSYPKGCKEAKRRSSPQGTGNRLSGK